MTCPGFKPSEVRDDESVLDHAGCVTDLQWHLNPLCPHLFCGCGSETEVCHPGECCTEQRDLLATVDSVCGLCRSRYERGHLAVAP